jgi:hypothetical protein
MGKPFPLFFFFFFFLGLTSAIGRADVSSEYGLGRGSGRGLGRGSGRGSGHARVGARGLEDKKHAGSFTGAWRRVRRFSASIFLVDQRIDETKPWMALKR